MTLTGLPQLPPSPVGLLASVTTEGETTIVTLCGEADVFTLPTVVEVLARVIAERDGAVIVDMTHTGFIDSSTVEALERASQFLDDRGRTLRLRSPSAMAARVLALLGLADLIEPELTTAN